MTDKELARRIVQCFKEDQCFWKHEKGSLEKLLCLDISSAFSWSDTKEGSLFWLNIAQRKIRNSKELRNFLNKNLNLEDSNFIELDLFI